MIRIHPVPGNVSTDKTVRVIMEELYKIEAFITTTVTIVGKSLLL